MTLKHRCFPAAACRYLPGNRWEKCPGKMDQVFAIGSLGAGSWDEQACFHSASVSLCKMAGNLVFQTLIPLALVCALTEMPQIFHG